MYIYIYTQKYSPMHVVGENFSANLLAHYMYVSIDPHTTSFLNAINSCLAAKHLTLNSQKCCYLFISRKRTSSIPPPCLNIGNLPLARVSKYKYLGITITADLMWSTHITNICNKTRRLIGLLYRRFYKFSSCSTMLRLYVSFIRPHLEYAAAAWDPFLKKRYRTYRGCAKN